MRSHLRPSPYNKRSQRKAAMVKKRPAVPPRDEQRQDSDYDPDPALEATPLKNGRE
ncbi:hypothetical protein [Stagnimonas aquatica]|uniref:hypothetical protein n=1 Tax=Stagnimonas aquatica TaxID=2689987 RepID=UPI00131599C2|nr:hypothetical protein [Stagnimonas aquatica]